MKVLHLFSNRKWTGPAEPCLTLCRSLKARGIQLDFACGQGGDPARNKVASMATEWGMPPLRGMLLDKHRHPLRNWRDGRVLHQILDLGEYDLVHCHLDNDHAIAVGAARELGIPLIRSSYEGEGLQGRRHARTLRDTAWLFEPSHIAADNDAGRYPFPRARMTVLPGSVDLARFDPDRPLPDMRKRLGIPDGSYVIGIVARMQTHRHYEDLFQAFRQVLEVAPSARLVVIGRGTKQEEVGFAPVRQLGISDRVVFTGYLDGDDYVGTLRALNAGVFLVPGSDGTCRAVRELLAMGVPMIVADRGMLREIVLDGVTGAVFDGSMEQLAGALKLLTTDSSLSRHYGEIARQHALAHFDPNTQAAQVVQVYERLVEETRRTRAARMA